MKFKRTDLAGFAAFAPAAPDRGRASKTVADRGEHALIAQIARWFEKDSATLDHGIGDDAALLRLGQKNPTLVVTTDALVENVHFRRDWIPPRDLGHKSLVANLSDLAAMAARPVAAFLALSLPGQTPLHDVREFFMGWRQAGRRWACPLAGGDLTAAPQWIVNVTVIGTLGPPGHRRAQPQAQAALRSTARPGQILYVTGAPGESGAGLEALRRGTDARHLIRRHCRPTPRLAEAQAIRRACSDLAMLDISDGIYNDAGNLARASHVGVEIELAKLKPSHALKRFARQVEIAPSHFQLFGGEDYELLFSTRQSADNLRAALAAAGIKTPLHPIGRIVESSGVKVYDPEGKPLALSDETYAHF